MKTKRLLCILTAILLLLAMCLSVASCNGNTPDETQPSEPSTPSGNGNGNGNGDDSGNNNGDNGNNNNGDNSDDDTPQTPLTKEEEYLKYIYDNPDVKKWEALRFTYPIWKEDISYCEMVFVHESNANGDIDDVQLLYDIDEIVSIRDNKLFTLYQEGRDYEITADKKLRILKSGNIKRMAYTKYNKTAYEQGYLHDNSNPGNYIYAGDIKTQFEPLAVYTINVTYKHSGESPVSEPYDQSEKLEQFIEKINLGEDVTIVALGDSITAGYSSSGYAGTYPNMPSYTALFETYIENAYGVNVTMKNLGVPGDSTWNAYYRVNPNDQTLIEKALSFNPDLVIVAYGMNDGTSRDSAAYIGSMNTIINTLRDASNGGIANLPIIVVGTCMPNPDAARYTNSGLKDCLVYQDDYIDAIWNEMDTNPAWSNNTVFADVGSIHLEILERKNFADTSGSNHNHPNDYMHRVYTQVIIQTVFGEFKPWDVAPKTN